MKCTNCNAEMMEGALFCSECGTRFSPPENIDTPSAEAVDTPSADAVDAPAADAVEAPADDATIPDQDPLEETLADDFPIPDSVVSPFVPATEAVSDAGAADDLSATSSGFQENADSLSQTVPIFQPAQNVAQPDPLQPSVPEYQPAPQPAAPMNYIDPSSPSEKKQKKFLVPMVIFAVLFALAAAAIGVGAYLFVKEKKDNKDLKAQVENYEADIDEKEDEISNLEDDIRTYEQKQKSLKDEVVQLTNDKDQLTNDLANVQNDITAAEKQRDEYKKQAEENANALNGVYTEIDNLGDSNKTFFANKNVLVLKKGETDTISVSLNATGNFTVYYKGDTGAYVTPKWENDWISEGKLATCSLTLTAGNTAGKTLFTFTNTANEDSFQLIVYVI